MALDIITWLMLYIMILAAVFLTFLGIDAYKEWKEKRD
jgi:predicted transporter